MIALLLDPCPVPPPPPRMVHGWLASRTDGPPLCGAPVPYLGRPIDGPYTVCADCADLILEMQR